MLLSLELGWPGLLQCLNNLKISSPSYLWCCKSCTHTRQSLPVRACSAFPLKPQFSSVAQSCLTLCDPMDCSTPCFLSITNFRMPAAAAAKSLQSCPTLCDHVDGSPPGSPVPGILQARTLEWVAFPSPMQESEK